jgi:hypothetical protein
VNTEAWSFEREIAKDIASGRLNGVRIANGTRKLADAYLALEARCAAMERNTHYLFARRR